MRSFYILLLFFLGVSTAHASDTLGNNRLLVTVTPQLCLNKLNLENDGHMPNPIIAHNTAGGVVGLEYERVTRSGFLFGGGLQYGIRPHNVDIYMDLSSFDPDAINALRGKSFSKHFMVTIPYVSPRISVGYRKQLDKKWAVSLNTGISLRYFLKKSFYEIDGPGKMTYTTDNGIIREERVITYTHELDSDLPEQKDLLKGWVYPFHCYLGTERTLKKGFIKNISAGLEFTGALSRKTMENPLVSRNGSYRITANARNSRAVYDLSDYSHDKYIDRYFSLGLRLAVGLWR